MKKFNLFITLVLFLTGTTTIDIQGQTGTPCFTCTGNSATGSKSFATGSNNTASGSNSFVGGDNSISKGIRSFAFGYKTTADSDNSFVLGTGSSTARLINTTPHSLLVGFQGIPTLTIKSVLTPGGVIIMNEPIGNDNSIIPPPIQGYETYEGRIGIGTKDPETPLHVAGVVKINYPGSVNDNVSNILLNVKGMAQLYKLKITSMQGTTYPAQRLLTVDNQGTVTAKDISSVIPSNTDNFGNHTATQNIKMNGYWLTNTGSSGNGLYISTNGNTGIGNSTVYEKLQIGDEWTFHNGENKIIGRNYKNVSSNAIRIKAGPVSCISLTGSGDIMFSTAVSGSANSTISTFNNFTIKNNGNVAIGTSDPGEYKLAVNGKIRAKEIKVEVSNWPDYVFEENYVLPTLTEMEHHIKENGHLQGVPSAAEIEENGVQIGEISAGLLKKIEELTLHMIEMDKRLKEQNELIEHQQTVIKQLLEK